MKQVEVL